MTTDLAAPPQTRPPHINRHWWYRATWHARQQVVNDHARASRPVDKTIEREEHHLASYTLDTEALIESATVLLDEGVNPYAIAERLGTTVAALEQRFRRRGLKDLARPFLKARKVERVHPCLDCGKDVSERAKRCQKCAAQEANNRPEVRKMRSERAKGNRFGEKRRAA